MANNRKTCQINESLSYRLRARVVRTVMKRGRLFLLVFCLGVLPAVSAGGEGTPEEEARRLNQQAVEFYQAGRYQEALPLQKRALEIYEKTMGPEHPDTATSLSNLAGLYQARGPATRPCPSTIGP